MRESTIRRFRRYGELGLPSDIMIRLAYDTAVSNGIWVVPLILAYHGAMAGETK